MTELFSTVMTDDHRRLSVPLEAIEPASKRTAKAPDQPNGTTQP